jgi:hypothetical protein
MKIKIKKLLKEANQGQGQDLGYTDVEDVRMTNGEMIDLAVLTPSDGIDHFEEEANVAPKNDAKEMTKKDYVNRIRDVVKGGREIPYLYYAYKGVDENGELLNNNDLTPVFELQLNKGGMLATRLEHAGDASVLMFLCDFGLLMKYHDEWDKRYEERMRELLPKRTYDRLAMKKGYDRAEFQSGRDTDLKPFSTVAIGRGSKPVFHQNVDFMYKTSPEPNKNVDINDLWAFSIRVPLAITYQILTGMGMPSKPKGMNDIQVQKYRKDRRRASAQRNIITRTKFTDAVNHWSAKEKEYRIQYAEKMMQEPNSWAAMHDNVSKLADMIRLTFKQFNHNYVEFEREGDKQRQKQSLEDQFGKHWADSVTPELSFSIPLIQPPPLSLTAQEALLEKLEDPELSKKVAKYIINNMTVNKNTEIKKNISYNLQQLVNSNTDDPAIQNNITWLQHAIQMYYIMGGK